MTDYYRVLSGILIVSFCLIILTVSPVSSEDKWNPQINLEGRVSSEGFIGQGGLLYPLKQDDSYLFYTDVRGMFAGSEALEANLGVGFRKLMEGKSLALGGYAFYDLRQEYDISWNQVTAGVEILTDYIDFRVNGYIPTADSVLAESLPADEIIIAGNNVAYEEALLNTYYSTMSGYDIEAGKRFTEELPVDLGVYVRAFKFTGNNMKEMSGKGIRLDTTFDVADNAQMKIGLDWQDDNVRGANTEATFGVSIPFGKGTSTTTDREQTSLEKRMNAPANRDINIVIGKSEPEREITESGKALDTESFQEVGEAWFVTADGNGDGSFENPTNLAELTDSGEGDSIVADENDLIIVLGDDGPIDTSVYSEGEGHLFLYSGQKLLSPGGYILLGNERKDRQAVYAPEGTQATLTNAPENDIVRLADDTTVSGIIFDSGNNAIYGNGVSGKLRITDNTIVNAGSNGIYIEGEEVESVVVSDNIVEMAAGEGIWLGVTNMLFADIPMGEGGPLPIGEEPVAGEPSSLNAVTDSNKFKVTVSGNEIKEAGNTGLSVNMYSDDESELSVTENTVEAAADGIELWSYAARTGTVDILANTVDTVDNNGLMIELNTPFEQLEGPPVYDEDGSSLVVTVAENHIRRAGNHGLAAKMLASADSDILVTENLVEIAQNDTGMGIMSYTSGTNNTDITANTVDHAYDGIDVEVFSMKDNNLNFTGNTVETAEDDGIMMEAEAGESNSLVVANNSVGSAADGYGIDIYSDASGENTTYVNDNTIGSSYYTSLYVSTDSDGSNETQITGNTIGISFDDDGIYVDTEAETDNVTIISDNSVDSTYAEGIEIDTTSYTGNNTTTVVNNHIVNAYDYGIDLDTDAEMDNVTTVTGNTVDSAFDDGFEIDTDSNTTNTTTITDNYVDYAADYGMDIYAGSSETETNTTVISGNTVIYAEYDGLEIYTRSGTENNTTVSNNIVDIAGDSGLEIDVHGDGGNVLTVAENTVNVAYDDGLDIYAHGNTGTNNVDIISNTIGKVEDEGIYLSSYADGDNSATVSGNSVDKTEDEGIDVNVNSYEGTGSLTITDNTINAVDYDGIEADVTGQIDSYLEITGNTVNYAGDYGINGDAIATTGVSTMIITDNIIGVTLDEGIYVYSSAGDSGSVTISGNTIESCGDDGIYLSLSGDGSREVSISDNSIGYAESDGINVYTSSVTDAAVNITDNQISNAASDGIYIYVYNSELATNITGNTVNAGNYAISLYANTDNTASIINALIEANILERGIDGGISLSAVSSVELDSTINAEINDNIFASDIVPDIFMDGEVVNVTGNQAP